MAKKKSGLHKIMRGAATGAYNSSPIGKAFPFDQKWPAGEFFQQFTKAGKPVSKKSKVARRGKGRK